MFKTIKKNSIQFLFFNRITPQRAAGISEVDHFHENGHMVL